MLRREPEGGYTVIVPTLPGCVTYGRTVDEAIAMGKEAIELYVESLQAHGEDVNDDRGREAGDESRAGHHSRSPVSNLRAR